MLHTGLFHSVAAGPVGGHQGCGTKNKHFRPDVPQPLDLLNGKLTILFLNGMLPNTVPLLFGELFTTIIYDGVAIDPGSPKMRRSLRPSPSAAEDRKSQKSLRLMPTKSTSAT